MSRLVAGLGGAIAGLPALLGVILGIRLVTSEAPALWVLLCACMLVAAILGLNFGQAALARAPRLGGWLVETWILAAIVVTAVATYVLVRINYVSLEWLIGRSENADLQKTVSTMLVGAVTAYIGLAWTKDIGDAKGYFWPSTQFKRGMSKALGALARKPGDGTSAHQAMVGDFVQDSHVEGWGFAARRARAKILADFLKANA